MNPNDATARIREALGRATHPFLLCSFGKDSMVVLDLCVRQGVKEVLYFPDLDEIQDSAHIGHVIKRYRVKVHRLPSGHSHFVVVRGQPMLTRFVPVAHNAAIPIPTTVVKFFDRGEKLYCLDDELRAYHGVVPERSADLLFYGQKLSDLRNRTCQVVVNELSDALFDSHGERVRSNGVHWWAVPERVRACSPILDWTDDEVWEYIEANKVPVSSKMYEGRVKRPSFAAFCYRCHDPQEPSAVQCPKTGSFLLNVAALTKPTDLRLVELQRLGMLAEEEVADLLRYPREVV